MSPQPPVPRHLLFALLEAPELTSVITNQALQLNLYVDGSAWEGLFDSLEVWRSRTTEGGPYEALTGATWSPATLPAGAPVTLPSPAQTGPSTTIVGKTLTLLVGGRTALTVTFTGTDPTTFATAATQIAAQGQGLLNAYVYQNLLVVQTRQAGSGALLQVTGGDAAPLLGLATTEPGNTAFGLSARIPLILGQENYQFIDVNGDPSFWYKTRFFDSSLGTFSEFSLPIQGRSISKLNPSNLILATVDLVDSRGVGKENQSILLYNRFAGTRVQGKTVIGDPLNQLTDCNGHAEFLVVRGVSFTVAISGTDLVRDITAPTDPSVQSFDLLDPALGSNDLFNVQVPRLNYAQRRSL